MNDTHPWSGVQLAAAGVSKTDLAGQQHQLLAPTTVTLTERSVAVLGPNGSGKSTFLRLLNGLLKPSTGQVLLSADTVERNRHRTGFLFPDPSAQLIMPTVAEDIQLSLEGFQPEGTSWFDRLKRTFQAPAYEQVAPEVLHTLEWVGLAELAQRSIFELSSGQRQLIALAAVLVRNPELFLADEPTTLLDLANTERVRLILERALAERRIEQLVLATHDLELAATAERALVFMDGQLVYDASAEEAIDWYRQKVRDGRY